MMVERNEKSFKLRRAEIEALRMKAKGKDDIPRVEGKERKKSRQKLRMKGK